MIKHLKGARWGDSFRRKRMFARRLILSKIRETNVRLAEENAKLLSDNVRLNGGYYEPKEDQAEIAFQAAAYRYLRDTNGARELFGNPAKVSPLHFSDKPNSDYPYPTTSVLGGKDFDDRMGEILKAYKETR